jgi:hypothetical protein
LGLFLLLKGTSPNVNSKPRLSLNEEKTCVILALASTKYELIGWLERIPDHIAKYTTSLSLIFYTFKFITDFVFMQD